MGKLAALKKSINKAHKIARRNAALPRDKGGFDLPADNTAMDRAEAMGFDNVRVTKTKTPLNEVDYAMYLDSNSYDGGIDEALDKVRHYGDNVWLAKADDGVLHFDDVKDRIIKAIDESGLIDDYQATAAELAEDANPDDIVNSAGLWDSPELADAVIEALREDGVQGVKTDDGLIIFSGSSHERSADAAFDPMKKDSANLLASAAPVGIGLAAMQSEDSEAGGLKAALKKLGGSNADRAARAKAQGWSDESVYHSTDIDFDEFDPDRAVGTQYRSVDADFNPALKDSSNLMAGVGGAAVLGAAMTPEDAQAATLEGVAMQGLAPDWINRRANKRSAWKKFKESIGEPALTIGTALGSMPLQGLAGVGALAQGYGINDAVGAMESTGEDLTYQPRSESGMESLQNVGEAMDIMGKSPPVDFVNKHTNQGADWAGENIHPAAGAFLKTLPEVVL